MATKLEFEIKVPFYGTEITIELEGLYTPSTPDVPYLRNGDPGYPGDPSEFDITRASVVMFGDSIVNPHVELPNIDETIDLDPDSIYRLADEAYQAQQAPREE